MKTKSKMATDIKSLVLARADKYTRHVPQDVSSSDEDTPDRSSLRKATESDKQKKREKKQVRQQKKKDARERSQKKDDDVAKTEALEYLRMWSEDRETWSFKKRLQCWLLSNVFSEESIPTEDFEIILNYIEDLKGMARTRLQEECEQRIKTHEEKGDSVTDADTTIFERARSILQIL